MTEWSREMNNCLRDLHNANQIGSSDPDLPTVDVIDGPLLFFKNDLT